MSHIGVLCLPVPGHLYPMAALGRELIRRGHRVTFFGIPDSEAAVREEGLDYWPIRAAAFPPGALAFHLARLGELRGLAALRYTTAMIARSTEALCRAAPAALRASGVDALLVDAVEPAGCCLAEYLGLPFLTIFNALVIREELAVPPVFTDWGPATSPRETLRNAGAYGLQYALSGQVGRTIWTFRRAWGLRALRGINASFSTLAQISQMPAALDLPRRSLPAHFHYTGPFRLGSWRAIPFPFERLDGRPLIYASLGTLQNRLGWIFETIAAACAGLDAQLVISLGGADPSRLPDLPGNPLVVRYAPQPELIARAALTITHAGMNTVLESLAHGTPMVAIPITNDQPGVAARLRHSGAGAVIPLAGLDARRLRTAIQQVRTGASYYRQARRLQQAIQRAGGVGHAAAIVEAAITTGRPVPRDAVCDNPGADSSGE